MHKIAILALDHVVPFDLSVPCGVFGTAQLANGEPAYRVQVCGPRRKIRSEFFQIEVPHALSQLLRADTIIIPGCQDIDLKIPTEVLETLQKAARKGIRIASICSGAFILAEAGLLNGRQATTHWIATRHLQERYPQIQVDANVLYVDEGNILTSAGAAAGLDLCLHMVRLDHGAAVAAHAAKLSVVPLERAGGQAQFIMREKEISEESLESLLRWMEKNLHRPLRLEELAQKAIMSPRSLHRRFMEETQLSPLQWLQQRRLRRSQELLETSHQNIEWIAEKTGFGTSANFREQFRRQIGVNPKTYRSSFKQSP